MNTYNPIDLAANDERLRDMQRQAEQHRLARSIPQPSLARSARHAIGRRLIAAGQHLTPNDGI